MLKEIDFSGFNGREEELESILRHKMEKRTPMHYRTNDLLHSRRIYYLLNDTLPSIVQTYSEEEFSQKKALTLALVHDDAEIITDDILLYYKDRMTTEQLAEHEVKEKQAIEELSKRWPEKINGFSYKELLFNALQKNCLEAQVVSYFDKLDGFCESLHEMYAGNLRFKGPAIAYVYKLRQFPQKFPLLKRILPDTHPLLRFIEDLNIEEILKQSAFHNPETIGKTTGISHYDKWKELTVKHFGLSPLIDVKE